MSKKIDKVAEAIRHACQEHDYLVSIPDNHCLWVNLARAAIAAKRDPAPEMIEQLGIVLYDHYGYPEDIYYAAEWEIGIREFIDCWIDEMLK